MAEPILLRQIGCDALQWLDLDAENPPVRTGSWADFAAAAAQRSLALVCPASDALLLETVLPVRRPAQIAKALPFAMEDQLVEDVDRYHLVWQRQPGDSRISVAAVAKSALADYRQRFMQAGLRLQLLLPEPLLLPWREGECSVLLEDGRGVFRDGIAKGGGGEWPFLQLLLQKRHADAAADGFYRVYNGGPAAGNQPEAWRSSQQEQAVEPLLLYAGQWRSAADMNLLTGPYAVSAAAPAAAKPGWWPAAALFLLAMGVQIAGQWYQLNQRQHELEALQSENQALFRQTFPEVKRLVNLKVQAEQQLQALQAQARAPGRFLDLLYQAGNEIGNDARLTLQGLQFDADTLQLHLSGQDAAALQALSGRLQQAGDLQVNLSNQVNHETGAEADLELKPR